VLQEQEEEVADPANQRIAEMRSLATRAWNRMLRTLSERFFERFFGSLKKSYKSLKRCKEVFDKIFRTTQEHTGFLGFVFLRCFFGNIVKIEEERISSIAEVNIFLEF
jgi:hypothetical protein